MATATTSTRQAFRISAPTPEGYLCTFSPRKIRYLRIRQTYNSANTGRHLVEVLAFEK